MRPNGEPQTYLYKLPQYQLTNQGCTLLSKEEAKAQKVSNAPWYVDLNLIPDHLTYNPAEDTPNLDQVSSSLSMNSYLDSKTEE